MKKYIERAAVHELVKRLPKYQMFNYDRTKSLIGINPDDVDFGVDKIPAADVAEVRHGRWIMRGGKFRCSECGAKAAWKKEGGTGGFSSEYAQVKSPYCPSCGARMGEEDEHEAD